MYKLLILVYYCLSFYRFVYHSCVCWCLRFYRVWFMLVSKILSCLSKCLNYNRFPWSDTVSLWRTVLSGLLVPVCFEDLIQVVCRRTVFSGLLVPVCLNDLVLSQVFVVCGSNGGCPWGTWVMVRCPSHGGSCMILRFRSILRPSTGSSWPSCLMKVLGG